MLCRQKGSQSAEAKSYPHKDKHDKNLNQEPYSDPQPTAAASVAIGCLKEEALCNLNLKVDSTTLQPVQTDDKKVNSFSVR